MLVSFGGQSITYDTIGNPINYLGNTMSWTGRTLDSITKADGTQISYTYDLDGIRTKKVVGGITTEYFVNGTTILAQKTGNDVIWFIYDVDGEILGFTYNDVAYYYVKNLQGDVVLIVNSIGLPMGSYTYDPWGKITSATGTMAEINPIRYRGYYYDSETGLYYLNSRYYDPDTCRFINADDPELLGVELENVAQYNLFAYCFNNPINMSDDAGAWPKWAKKLVAAVAVVAVVAVVAAVTVATAGAGTAIACVAIGAAKGAAVGLVTGAVSGAATGAVSHRMSTGSWDGAGQAALDGMADGALSGAITGAITGAVTSPYCFVAGTVVLTSTGYVAIENITEGDIVFAWNQETNEVELKQVVETYVNQTNELVYIHVNGEEIITTPSHPFYSPVKGWVDAIELRAGDVLILVNGEYVVVERVQHEILETPVTVYNFQVEDNHTYYVGESGILVHNTCHGNSLKSSKKTDLYVLRDKTTNTVQKIGETTRGVKRYTKAFYSKNNVYMQVVDSGTKRAMHFQQHRWLNNYFSHIGKLPNLNKSLW